ncbi:MAG: hypothetical protein ACREHG_07275 [Candidatus Saccharimonadales bacterium]
MEKGSQFLVCEIMRHIGAWGIRRAPFGFGFRPFTFAGIIDEVPYGRGPDPAGIAAFRQPWITPGYYSIGKGIRFRIVVYNMIVEIMQVLVIASAPTPRSLPA